MERFTRVDSDTLLYEFTVEDPAVWTRPWTAQIAMSKSEQGIYKYACHEGNYGLFGILGGARAKETGSGEGGGGLEAGSIDRDAYRIPQREDRLF